MGDENVLMKIKKTTKPKKSPILRCLTTEKKRCLAVGYTRS